MLFPPRVTDGPQTGIELDTSGDTMPTVLWTGLVAEGRTDPGGYPSVPNGPGMPLLGEHSHERFTRPPLRGHRVEVDDDRLGAGRSWSTRFVRRDIAATDTTLSITAADPEAGLELLTEVEVVPGGALRARHTLTNTAAGHYLLEGLEVVLPAGDDLTEVLDFTGRHERERTPQRHEVTDGLWLRETREGRPGLGAATMVVLGSPGFSPTAGRVLGVHVAWSGNSVLRVERDAAGGPTVGGGELLQPGEVVLAQGGTYRTPWVFFAAADDGLDGLAATWHAYQRSLDAHPTHAPVVLNVWEAVWFDHDLERLRGIADRAARVGVERFVLDDGWFHGRRDDTAGLGDWWIDPTVWPDGLDPIVDHVRGLGMDFGLWFEPEMVNPDSDLYRAAPRLDPRRRRPGAGPAPPPAGARPLAPRGLRPRALQRQLGALRAPDRLREVGPQPRAPGGR